MAGNMAVFDGGVQLRGLIVSGILYFCALVDEQAMMLGCSEDGLFKREKACIANHLFISGAEV